MKKSTKRALSTDFRRLFCSKELYLTIVGIVAVCWLSIWEEVKNLWYDEQIGSVYYFINVRKGIGAFFFGVHCIMCAAF